MRCSLTTAGTMTRAPRESQAEHGSQTDENTHLNVYEFKFTENWRAELKEF